MVQCNNILTFILVPYGFWFTFMPLWGGMGWFKAFCIEKIIKARCYFIRRLEISLKCRPRTENGDEGRGYSKCRVTFITFVFSESCGIFVASFHGS